MLATPSPERGVHPALARQQELTADSLWTEVSDRLKGALNDTTFGTWFGDVSARELNERAFVLSVPNDFTRDWIEGHFLDLIGAAVRDATGDQKEIQPLRRARGRAVRPDRGCAEADGPPRRSR